MCSKGVLNYDSGVCCFKEVKTNAKIVIILAFQTRNTSKYESIDIYNLGLVIYASLRTPASSFCGSEQGFGGKNCQDGSQGKP